MVFSDLIDNGRRFHNTGAATMKERSPIVSFVLICGEHKRRPLLSGKTNIKSIRCVGAKPCRILNIIKRILNSICLHAGNR